MERLTHLDLHDAASRRLEGRLGRVYTTRTIAEWTADDPGELPLAQSTIDSFWDLAYDSGEHLEHWESPEIPAELVTAVAAGLVPTAGRVLDIGCGAGSEAIFLARQGFRASGVDSSRRAIELARDQAAQSGVEVDFRCADAACLPFANQSIDFACDRGCLHVIDRGQRSGYARELRRVLRPGARFLLRGAALDDEEEGLVAVDAEAIERLFLRRGFTSGPIVPVALVAASGTVQGNLAVLVRSKDPGD